MNRSSRLVILGLGAFLGLAWGATSLGCPVCFGESDAPIVKGVQMSVLFMIGITYSLMFSGVAAVIVLRRRALSQNGAQELPKNERADSALSLE
jgi:hypothetical protein